MLRKKFITIFLLLTIINTLVFVFRDQFQYQPYSTYSSLYSGCNNNCGTKWKQYFKDFYSLADLEETKRISDSVIGQKAGTTSQKIILIGGFIYNRFKKQMGIPSGNLVPSSPLEQYKKLSSSDSIKIWCGNFAHIFSFFCWSQEIVCRTIGVMNPGDNHVLNECYLPEQGKWVVVDVTNNQLLVKNNEEIFLDLPAFRDSLKKSALLYVVQATNDSIQTNTISDDVSYIANHYLGGHPFYYYHRLYNQEIYSSANKIKRYLLPVSWYDIFEGKRHSNILFYLKELLILLWILSFLFLLLVVRNLKHD